MWVERFRSGQGAARALLRRRRWGACVPLASGLLLGVACSGGGRSPGLDGHLTRDGIDAGSLPHSGDAGPSSGDAGSGGSDAGASDAGDATAGPCGNAQLDPGEDCDPGLPGLSCLALGFDVGQLSCDPGCTWNRDACSGTESCYDGRDNDGDGLVDCADEGDCAAVCADACAAPLLLAENTSASGTTLGHAAVLSSSCSEAAPSGAEVVYQVEVSEDAKLDVLLSSPHPLSLSLRTSCADAASEIRCGSETRLTLDVLAGETYFIVVDGVAPGDAGEYLLEVNARQQACGDGIRDEGEACDDGNINDGDGCDPDCAVEASESEPNGWRFSSDTFDFTPWFAELSPAGDVDYYRVSLAASSSTLVVNTLNFGDGACAFNLMDTVVDILDTNANGNVVLASDDDSGDGKCSRALATGLPPGNYYVRVQAADGADPATFPYRLDVFVGVCGDGKVTLGEACDDENLEDGDGCDRNCRLEESSL